MIFSFIKLSQQKEVKALIDLGSEKGIKKKDKFIVFRKGEDIKHPVTGEMIPGRIEELGEAEVKSVDIATAEVKIKTKKKIQIGDCIRSKEKKKSFWKKIQQWNADNTDDADSHGFLSAFHFIL